MSQQENGMKSNRVHDNAVFVMDEHDGKGGVHINPGTSENGGTPGHHEGKASYMSHGQSSMVDNNETVTLSWEDLNVNVIPQKRACCRGPDPSVPTKTILRNVFGHVKPGSLLAIIGASGSGKTTLMNTLTCRNNPETMAMTGSIHVNGVDVGTGIRNISAYVQQDDMFIATMTVREHLTFRALLRMEREVPRKRRLDRVDEVIKELGLSKCSENIIGNPGRIKGISGGEMRRLSFASEILTNPPLLFCDEPTSGLDSFMAENIVQTLKGMTEKGKTVLCTIHQPSSEVFALFDHLLIMAEGRVAFMGPSQEALKFFASVGCPAPTNFNPADFYILTMAVKHGIEEECKRKIESICDTFERTEQCKSLRNDTTKACTNPTRSGVIFEEAFSSTSRYEAPWYSQFRAVFGRCIKTVFREPMVLKVRFGQTLVLAIALGLIYLQLDLDQEGVMNVNGVIFLMITNMSFSSIFGVINTFPIEVPIFLREYGIGLYRVDIYFISKILAELPSFVMVPVVFCAITYWMVGLYADFVSFCVFTGVLILVSNCAVSFGYVVSTAVGSVNTALAVAPPLMIPLLMFGGFFLNSDSIPVYLIWLEYMSWFKYANELLTVNQWTNIDAIDCPSGGNSTKCLFRDGTAVLEYLNYSEDNVLFDIMLLLALLVGYRVISFIVLFIRARRSKA